MSFDLIMLLLCAVAVLGGGLIYLLLDGAFGDAWDR